jgi:hypothetical protein
MVENQQAALFLLRLGHTVAGLASTKQLFIALVLGANWISNHLSATCQPELNGLTESTHSPQNRQMASGCANRQRWVVSDVHVPYVPYVPHHAGQVWLYSRIYIW